jgi:hypothetical protein
MEARGDEQPGLTDVQQASVVLLCSKFRPSGSGSSTGIDVAITLLKTADGVVPMPFNLIVKAGLQVLNLAHRAVVNKRACAKLARRIAHVSFIILELTVKETTWSNQAVIQCTHALTEEFNRAVKLLEEFQSGQNPSWLERAQIVVKRCSENTIKEFTDIHAALDSLVTQANLGVALAIYDRAPSIDDIRAAMHDEMAHVAEEIRWQQQEIQAVLDAPAFKELSGRQVRQTVFMPRDVFIDKKTVLGRGASSVVYAGMLYGQSQVAVKVIEVVRKGALQRVKDEIRRANLARHKNVVHVFGIVTFEDETSVGVVMERLGESLEKVKTDDARLRMKYTLDIIAGMEHMHDAKHAREVRFGLKPANILLTEDGRSVKIIDFGVAQTAETLAAGAIASIRATLRFVAPELFADELEPSSACDVYSFAVLLAELWTGTVAWHETPEDQIPAAVVDGQRPFSRDDLSTLGVPDPIIALIVACWAQDPRRRPDSSQIGKLRDIPNFHRTKEGEWPSFLPAARAHSIEQDMSHHELRPCS